jgi:hypothetical protein
LHPVLFHIPDLGMKGYLKKILVIFTMFL